MRRWNRSDTGLRLVRKPVVGLIRIQGEARLLPDELRMFEANVIAPFHFLEAMKAAGVTRLILASGICVAGTINSDDVVESAGRYYPETESRPLNPAGRPDAPLYSFGKAKRVLGYDSRQPAFSAAIPPGVCPCPLELPMPESSFAMLTNRYVSISTFSGSR